MFPIFAYVMKDIRAMIVVFNRNVTITVVLWELVKFIFQILNVDVHKMKREAERIAVQFCIFRYNILFK